MAKRLFQYLLIFTVVWGFMALTAERGYSQLPEDGCGIIIFKETPQVESVPFDFIFNLNGVETDVTIFSNGGFEELLLDQGDIFTVTELSQEGWVLEDIECLPFNVEITESGNSLEIVCPENVEFGFAICVFENRISPDKIPTLSEWGMISAAVGLGLIGVFFAVRRRRMQGA